MKEIIIGIDLGTTHSAVGVVESGFPLLLANEDQQRIIPSAVYYNGEQVEVGKKALAQQKKQAKAGKLVTSVKRLMGHSIKNNTLANFPHPLKMSEGKHYIQLGELRKTPEQVSADILKELKRIAEYRLEKKVNKAVITVPAYFNDAQRNATKTAGELAGLEVVRILSEPTAAALAFGLNKLEEQSRVIVYDLGGGTFDVSLLELNGGVFQVEATSGDTQLGGDDIDKLLAEWAWQQAHSSDFNTEKTATKLQILQAAKQAKETLAQREETKLKLPATEQHAATEQLINQDILQKLTQKFIEKTLHHCRQVLTDCNIKNPAEELSNILLVGGSSRLPQVRTAVEQFFNKAPDLSQHPDEAIALGAVIQAGILSGDLRDMVLLDVTPLSLGVETYGGLMNVLIPRNSTIPCKAGEMFTNAIDCQQSMRVHILQGEREMAKDNWTLGNLSVPFEQTRKGQARVGVQFSIDENGILEVLSRDTQTGKDTVLKIDNAAVDVSDEQVEQMVSESVEHAFEDMAERIFTEAKLKAQELLPAVESALKQMGSTLDDADKKKIEQSKQAVKKALQDKEANALKSAVQELDHATEYLATLLIEQAMEQALLSKMEQ